MNSNMDILILSCIIMQSLFDIYFALNVVFDNKLLTVLSDMINFIIHEK